MTSFQAAHRFLSHIGFAPSDASAVLHRFDNQMSRLMVCSHRELIPCDLSLTLRLRLLRAIRCFHMEKWSKYLLNHFHLDNTRPDRFERLVSQLIKSHIWIIYASWTMQYIERHLFVNDEDVHFFYEKLRRLSHSIARLQQMIVFIEKHLASA